MPLKPLDTFGYFQSPVFSLGVSQNVNKKMRMRENNLRQKRRCRICCVNCLELKSRMKIKYFSGKLHPSQRLYTLEGAISTFYSINSSPMLSRVSFYNNYFEKLPNKLVSIAPLYSTSILGFINNNSKRGHNWKAVDIYVGSGHYW